jgi:hypothetical protein
MTVHASNIKSHRGIITARRRNHTIVSATAPLRAKGIEITYDAVATDTGGVSVTDMAPAKRPLVKDEALSGPDDEPEFEAADVGQECSISVFGNKIRLYVMESLILDPCAEEDPTPQIPGDATPIDPVPPISREPTIG